MRSSVEGRHGVTSRLCQAHSRKPQQHQQCLKRSWWPAYCVWVACGLWSIMLLLTDSTHSAGMDGVGRGDDGTGDAPTGKTTTKPLFAGRATLEHARTNRTLSMPARLARDVLFITSPTSMYNVTPPLMPFLVVSPYKKRNKKYKCPPS